jgi:hypothetical protein
MATPLGFEPKFPSSEELGVLKIANKGTITAWWDLHPRPPAYKAGALLPELQGIPLQLPLDEGVKV